MRTRSNVLVANEIPLIFATPVCDGHRSKDATANAAKKQPVERCQAKRQNNCAGNVKHKISSTDSAAPDKNKGEQAIHDDSDWNDVIVPAHPIEELDDGSAVAFRVKGFVGLMGDMHDVLHGKGVKHK
jgi:hypothetical protein